MADLVHLSAGGVSVVLDVARGQAPSVGYWGMALGDVDAADLDTLARATEPVLPRNGLDVSERAWLMPQPADGWMGTPGLQGRRDDGTDWSPRLVVTEVARADDRLVVTCADGAARLGVTHELELGASGLLRMRTSVRNDADLRYHLDSLLTALPVPARARELLDLAGGWARERQPQRHPFHVGTLTRDGRRGRTGTDATLLLIAGTSGFGNRHGEVWGVHVAWSGNHRTYAERTQAGTALLGGGELLSPGEITLEPGATYAGPWLYGSYGRGLDELSTRFHDHLRARPSHPTRPRPVVLNTWEAVYFGQDLDTLTRLAELGARVGAERFVLDDGWFRGRRSDRAGLGDWYVDEELWPDGLHPLVDRVRELGLEFGLWVEPEMVSPDSDLLRAHPEWMVSAGGRTPPTGRGQQVLDLARPEAWAYLLERLDALVTEYALDYLKWDHNRDLVDARVHAQTAATYALMDELRRRHPGLEIESCASGGGRIDLGILERTDRVWASDDIDPHERQRIQRWTQLLLPPELVGSHIASPRSHSTGRTHTLAFRAGTALFGHLGIEWDLTSADETELDELAWWVARHKERRELLHRGRVVHADAHDPSLQVHGVVAPDARTALFAVVSTDMAVTSPAGQVHLVGLDPETRYRVTVLAPEGKGPRPPHLDPPWLADGVELPGSLLAGAGLAAPACVPDRLVLLDVTAVDPTPAKEIS